MKIHSIGICSSKLSSITYCVALIETSQITFQGGGSSAKTNVARGTLPLSRALMTTLTDDMTSETLENGVWWPQTLPTLGALRPHGLLLDLIVHPGLHFHHLLPEPPQLLQHPLKKVRAGQGLGLVHLPLPVGGDLCSHLQLSLSVQDVGVEKLVMSQER